MSKEGRLIDIGKSLYDVVLYFQNTYTTLYKVLRQEQNDAIDNFEKEKKGRSKEEQDYIDKKINAFKIIRNRELPKHVDLINDLKEAVTLTDGIYNNAKILERDKKQKEVTTETIQEKIEQILPMLERIFSNSDFILKRILKHKAYVLKEQDELKKAGLTFDPQEEVLRSQLENLAAGVKDEQSFLGAFKQARGSINTAHGNYFGGRIATIRGGIKTNWSSPTAVKKAEREDKKNDITQHLSSATPDSLSSMSGEMKQKISSYVRGRAPADDQTDIEKLIYEKTGKSKDEILSGDFDFPAPAKPIDAGIGGSIGGGKGSTGGGGGKGGASSPMEASQKMSSALVPYTGPGQTSTSDSDYLQEYADKLKNEKSQSSIEKAGNSAVQKKTRAKKGGGKIVSLGGGGKGGGKGGGTGGGGTGGGGTGGGGTGGSTKKAPGGGPITDVRLVDITTSAIKQLEDLLIKVLKQSNITASKKSPASTSKGPKVAPIGGTAPTTSSGAKIVPFNNTPTTPGGLTVIPGGLGQSPTPGGTTPTTSSGGTIGTSFTVGQTVIPGATTPAASSGAKIIPFNNTTPTPGGLTVIPGGLNQSATPGGTTPPPAKGSTTKQPKLPKDVLDPFRKRLLKIFKEGEEELTFLYAKTDSFIGWIPGFNSAILDARKMGLETLKKGYTAFDEEYVESGGSAIKGMWASVKAMFKVSPFTVVMAGLTTAFIGILGAATRLNNKIKEISAELGTSNMQSYEFFKNAMNAQTQYDNMYASLRDVRDVQKGILGDSGILLQVNDKALASIADNAKNIGVSTEAAGAFTEALRTKGATDVEAANLAAASLELADKSGFIMPQSVMEDIAQNVEFSAKYFSGINKDSKSAKQHLVDTNLQVKALGLNFQKAAKMTQHLLSFEQSITAEVEASVALGRHVNIGKARELLLQDDIGGAMEQMMNEMGGYDAFQNDMDFAQRQLLANAVGMEVSELEKSLYLRDKIGITNEEALNAAMKNSDYLDKVAGKDVELYKIEAKKVLAAERFNTAVEKVGVAFKSSLLPILEAIIPIVDHIAWAINGIAEGVKFAVGGLASVVNVISFGSISNKRKDENTASPAEMAASSGLMVSAILGTLMLGKSKAGGKLGEVVGKARGGLDAVTGTLGSKSNPMYVQIVGGGAGGGGGIEEILDSVGGGGKKGGRAGFLKRMRTSKNVVDRAKSIQKIRDARIPKTGALAKIGQYLTKVKIPSIPKIGGALAIIGAIGDFSNRKSQGQSNTQAVAGTAGGVGGALIGAKGGALAGAAIGGAIGTAVPVIGNIVGAAVGGAIGGLAGGAAGYYAGGAVVDSQFKGGKKDSSYQTQPFQYQGMGLSATGSIYGGVNKPTAKGIPVETSMVDTTPTTLKPNFSNPFNTTPNYGTTSMSRDSVIANTTSKSVSASATIQNTLKEKEKSEEALLKATDYTNKLLENLISKQNSPVIAYFNDEGRRQVKSTLRKESSP
jgi:hypothetical protein